MSGHPGDNSVRAWGRRKPRRSDLCSLDRDSLVTTASVLAAPSVFGSRYRLGELLGRGGMSEVYRGLDQVTGTDVAIKVLRGGGSPGADRPQDAELTLLSRLSHPHLVSVLDAGSEAGLRYVIMDLVEGCTLADLIRDAALPPDRVAEIGAEIASGLAYVHAAGVVHRDVKPGNVLMSVDHGAQLTDFGIARLVDSTRVTPSGFAVGTAAYLAPE